MVVFVISFLVMVAVVLAMSIGVIVANKRIRGSCGGLNALGIPRACDCPSPCEKRKRAMAEASGNQESTTHVVRFR
jgi:hypothetical protein